MNKKNTRKEKDVMKLLMSNYEVTITDENNPNDLFVLFDGPKDSPYEGVSILFYCSRVYGKCMSFFLITTPISLQALDFIIKCSTLT